MVCISSLLAHFWRRNVLSFTINYLPGYSLHTGKPVDYRKKRDQKTLTVPFCTHTLTYFVILKVCDLTTVFLSLEMSGLFVTLFHEMVVKGWRYIYLVFS